VPVRWLTEIRSWQPPRSFTDVQLSGPYSVWEHTHRFTEVEGGTEVYDHVRYGIPLGPLGAAARRLGVRAWLDEIFDYRSRRLRELLEPAT
jgi:ligand-binding SRPBCC domain-containing protein